MYDMKFANDAEVKPAEPEAASAGSDSVTTNGDNRIMFYADVSSKTALELHEKIQSKSLELNSLSFKYKIPPIQIDLHIQSFGGSLLSGFAALDSVRACQVPINTIINGYAASAATLFSVAGKKRYMTKHSYMLIHQLSSMTWGTYEEIKDHKENMDKFMDMIKAIYKEYTSVPMKKLEEILKHDIWFNREECLKYDLVDEVLP